jgi:hypothetical protein
MDKNVRVICLLYYQWAKGHNIYYMYRWKYAGSPLTYGETTIYRYIHLTLPPQTHGGSITLSFWRVRNHAALESVPS